MHCYSILVFWPDCKVPDVSSVGPIPWLTLPFSTGIIRDLSLTAEHGCGWRMGWSVPHTGAHAEKREKWFRRLQYGVGRKKKGRDALGDSYPKSIPIQHLCRLTYPCFPQMNQGGITIMRNCLQSPSEISLAMSKISNFLWPWRSSNVSSASRPRPVSVVARGCVWSQREAVVCTAGC